VTFDSQTARVATIEALGATTCERVVGGRGRARFNRAHGRLTWSCWASVEDDAPRVPAGRVTLQ
jgi:hypothetical protein